jgi:hypothetical protein
MHRIPEAVRVAVKQLVPTPLMRLRRSLTLYRIQRRFSGKTAAETFSEIYRAGLWVGGSGAGSKERFAAQYAEAIASFARSHSIGSVVDIGCGDFVVGQKLVDSGLGYWGVDVVAALIDEHNARFEREGVRFSCVDVIREAPPFGELCLIRQVLQHLSNNEISQVLLNCRNFRYVLVTEHLPIGQHVMPNRDKTHGPDTRLDYLPRSGVFLECPPFSINTETVFEFPYQDQEILRTVLIQNNVD